MEGIHMKKYLLLVVGLTLSPIVLSSQEKPVIVVQVFTAASDVVWPYDMKQMQAQIVAEFKVTLGKDFDIVAEAPSTPPSKVFTLANRNNRLASRQRREAHYRRFGFRSGIC